MAEVVWRPAALDDLDEIDAFLRRVDPDAAERYRARLTELGQSLALFANRGRPSAAGTREMVVVPPFVLTYRVEGEEVSILSVRHGARRPV